MSTTLIPFLGPQVTNPTVLLPSLTPLIGQHCTLQPLSQHHLPTLYQSIKHPSLWQWVRHHPPASLESLKHLMLTTQKPHYHFYVLKSSPTSSRSLGCIAYKTPSLEHRAIQIGFVKYAPDIQRSTLTTEAFYLLAKHAFENLKYHRLIWRSNRLNEQYVRAAERFGFKYEGCGRQECIEKGYWRDTRYYSIMAEEWGRLREEYEKWLDKGNFDEEGKERRKLQVREVRERMEKDEGLRAKL